MAKAMLGLNNERHTMEIWLTVDSAIVILTSSEYMPLYNEVINESETDMRYVEAVITQRQYKVIRESQP